MDTSHHLLGAIEAGGTKFVCAVGTGPSDIWDQIVIPTTSPEETLAATEAFFRATWATHGRLDALGVASFGPIDIDPASPRWGTILTTPKPGWTGADLRGALLPLSKRLAFETDVSGAGVGEWIAGAGRGVETLAYITVGTGIGVGVIKDGKPLSGMGHLELGHIYVPHDRSKDPFPGRCPFHGGCLEGLASGPAILDRFGRTLSELGPKHRGLVMEADYLAYLLTTLILSHMPDRIIMGGGVMKTPGLIERVRARTRALLGGYPPRAPYKDFDSYIVPPALGDHAGITGAFTLAQAALGT